MDGIIWNYLILIGGWKIVTILVLILLDTILGIILAVKSKQFQWSKIADFLNSSVLLMFGAYFLLGVFAMAEPSYAAVVPATLALIDFKLAVDIVIKFKNLGIVFPDS